MQAASLQTAIRALGYVAPDDRDTWIRMGMGLKAEFGDDAYEAWVNWSSSASSYDSKACEASWRSFKSAGKVGIGSLFAEAKAAGFEFAADEVEVSPEVLAARQKKREQEEARAEENRKKAAAAAANRAASQWRMASPDGASPYLERKQVNAESCRFLADGAIIIPMIRYDETPPRLVGKQQINADGSKKFSSGMIKTGAMCRLGDAPSDDDIIFVVEGFATGGSVRAALHYTFPVFICFDAGMLMPGVEILRKLYPNSRIVICADDDYLTGNAGFTKASAAASKFNASVFLPTFSAERRASKSDDSLPMLTDCNDLHVAESLAELGSQLQAFLSAFTDTDSRALSSGEASKENCGPKLESLLQHFALVYGKTDVWDSLNKQLLKKAAFAAFAGAKLAKEWLEHPERKNIDQKDLPLLKGGRAISSKEGIGGDPLLELIDRYVLLYGTETVWDRTARKVVGLGPLRSAYPDLAGRWLESPKRAMVDADNLVFDPAQRSNPETHINMFSGYPLKPKQNIELQNLVLALVGSLCSTERNADEVADWLIKWLAYPLQNPGAKMSTAVLMFGEKQGTGKSLFFDGIMRPIYGEYGTTAGQHQLESNFTDWRSRKTFVLFEEVLGRAERHNYMSTIKHMITGKDMRINPKGLPERVEANHVNAAFLSNERQPLPLDAEDRRFQVIEALAHMDPSFYAQFKDAIKNGACEAFYHYLLNVDLGDFNEHTMPIRTDSKDTVIAFGLPSWEIFYQRWRDGELDAPYCSCLTEELHTIYMRWCERTNEKKLSLTKFSELISGRETKSRKWTHLRNDAAKKMRTVLMVGDNPETSLNQDVQRFRDALEKN
ncbi:hypothetical protein E6Q11_00075 [Candidatus Dojkabacteria bacterium]|uniref:Uncharacterized protein n=1 Tax=Candidatus Dojkabacteria bacterium TaxID=2099670 RepID=A0A5C7JBG2_9BACT|nr:MAG: hypothetical protein E6Q11_00075 [Candidatus Dojkabacteria bacterium]